MTKKKAQKRFVFACLAPAIILVCLFMVYPTLQVFRISMFEKPKFVSPETFVGLGNFKELMSDMTFVESLQNTILIIVIVTLFTVILAILFATLLTRENFKGKNIFRVIFYIPNILNIVVIAGIFSAIYAPSNGLLNSLLVTLHLDGLTQQWMGNPDIVLYSIIAALVWQAIGYYMVMYMASMANVPESLYESASLEGAGKIKQFFSITLPLIWTNIRTTLTFFIISTINMSFLFVKAMTNGGPDGASNVFLSYMYQEAYTNSSYGYGMAIGSVVFIFSFALAGILNVVTKREEIEF